MAAFFKTNHLSPEDFVLVFYDEAGVSTAMRQHLAECEACKREMADLRTTLRMADEYAVPNPAADFERAVWARLAPALEDRKRGWNWRVWVLIPAVAVVLLGVFYAGRATKPVPAIAGLSKQARERILVISLADHLERTGFLLTGLSNVGDTEEFPLDRERARDLIDEGRLMRQALDLSGDRASGQLLTQLERVLLEVANSPDKVSVAAMRKWQLRIEGDSLLFKVRVVESNLRTKGQKL